MPVTFWLLQRHRLQMTVHTNHPLGFTMHCGHNENRHEVSEHGSDLSQPWSKHSLTCVIIDQREVDGSSRHHTPSTAVPQFKLSSKSLTRSSVLLMDKPVTPLFLARFGCFFMRCILQCFQV